MHILCVREVYIYINIYIHVCMCVCVCVYSMICACVNQSRGLPTHQVLHCGEASEVVVRVVGAAVVIGSAVTVGAAVVIELGG